MHLSAIPTNCYDSPGNRAHFHKATLFVLRSDFGSVYREISMLSTLPTQVRETLEFPLIQMNGYGHVYLY